MNNIRIFSKHHLLPKRWILTVKIQHVHFTLQSLLLKVLESNLTPEFNSMNTETL